MINTPRNYFRWGFLCGFDLSLLSRFAFAATRFRYRWTILAPEAPAIRLAVASRAASIFLVDDDILVSMGAADMLLDLGHSVTEAQSGPHALNLLETDAPFDIVVTDYAMPGMNGFELAQKIRQRNPKLPIVLATGYVELPADRSSSGPAHAANLTVVSATLSNDDLPEQSETDQY